MAKEYEVISHSQFRNLNVLLVRMISRTTHLHREIEIGTILDGSVELQIGSERYILNKGDIYIVNPFEAHEFLSKQKGALILSIQFSPQLMKAFLPESPNIRFEGSASVREHFVGQEERYAFLNMLCVELAYTYFGCMQEYEYRCFSLTAQLLHQITHNIPNRVLSRQDYLPLQQKNDRILSVTNYIEANFTHKLLLEDIARREGVSMPYLSHLFKDTLGISFQEYLKQKRFEHACNLIATTQRKILDISISSGFSDVRYLSELFRERFGCSPKEYRQAIAKPIERSVVPPENTQYLFTRQDGYLLLTPIRDKMRSELSSVSLDNVW